MLRFPRRTSARKLPITHRVQLQVESLEAKVLPSANLALVSTPAIVHTAPVHTASPIDKFTGTWNLHYDFDLVFKHKVGDITVTIVRDPAHSNRGLLELKGIAIGNIDAQGNIVASLPLGKNISIKGKIDTTTNKTFQGNITTTTGSLKVELGTFNGTKIAIPNLKVLDGSYRISFSGFDTSGTHAIHGHLDFLVNNGKITPFFAHGQGYITKTGEVHGAFTWSNNTFALINSMVQLKHGVPSISGNWHGTFQGLAFSGIWTASRTR